MAFSIETQPPLLIESAVSQVIMLMRLHMAPALAVVAEDQQGSDDNGDRLVLTPIPWDRYYISEQIDPFKKPAVFVLDGDTTFPKAAGGGQNISHALHSLNVTIVVEDTTAKRLVLRTWRYARAAYLSLHDQTTPSINVFVDRMVYGPAFFTDARSFQRDITLGVRVMHFENFQ